MTDTIAAVPIEEADAAEEVEVPDSLLVEYAPLVEFTFDEECWEIRFGFTLRGPDVADWLDVAHLGGPHGERWREKVTGKFWEHFADRAEAPLVRYLKAKADHMFLADWDPIWEEAEKILGRALYETLEAFPESCFNVCLEKIPGLLPLEPREALYATAYRLLERHEKVLA